MKNLIKILFILVLVSIPVRGTSVKAGHKDPTVIYSGITPGGSEEREIHKKFGENKQIHRTDGMIDTITYSRGEDSHFYEDFYDEQITSDPTRDEAGNAKRRSWRVFT